MKISISIFLYIIKKIFTLIMQRIQISDYTRPGIFTNEFDESVFQTPLVDAPLASCVIGFSRKGPVNQMVQLNSVSDLERIFGTIDRNLESKGSFFHRTVSSLLDFAPVMAMNLLLTDDTLDTLQYQSLSAATDVNNASKTTSAYSNFFNTTGFWNRDTEEFIDLAFPVGSTRNKVLNITNMGDKPITVWVYKTKVTGYDVSMLTWYRTNDKIPSYLNAKDLVSDYMVDVVVVSGNWTDYASLSVDSRWSNYFNTSGLKKENIESFLNDRNVTNLAYYKGVSMIPYFQNENGENVFIETIINRETDRTGLFCAFDIDSFETDYPNGLVDLIGNNLVDSSSTNIEFLSYNDKITERVVYSQTELDRAGNTISFGGDYYRNLALERTGFYSEGIVQGVTFTSVSGGATATATITYAVSTTAYAVINGTQVSLNTTGSTVNETFTLSKANYSDSQNGYRAAVVIDNTGEISLVENNTTLNTNPTVNDDDIVLGYFEIVTGTTTFTSVTENHVTVNASGYVDLEEGVDFNRTVNTTTGKITWEFIVTNPLVTNYEEYRRYKMFNYMLTYLNGSNKNKMVILGASLTKYSLADMTVGDIVNNTTSNKTISITTGLAEAALDIGATGSPDDSALCIYLVDDEFIIGNQEMSSTPLVYNSGTPNIGIAARYSEIYEDYVNGVINTGDYAWENFISSTYTTVGFATNSGDNFIVFTGGDDPEPLYGQKLLIKDDEDSNVWTVIDVDDYSGTVGGTYAYKVAETVDTTVSYSSVDTIYDANEDNRFYLNMYLNTSVTSTHSTGLKIEFKNSALSSTKTLTNGSGLTDSVASLEVRSRKSNLKQTLEIESPSGYTRESNKMLIDSERYSEVKVGDYVEAYVDTASLEDGQVARKLTRIISKVTWPTDTTLVEVTCDDAIKVSTRATNELQTTRYVGIDNYVSDYKGIALNPFKVRAASMPDGTDDRLKEILASIGSTTNLFKALTNKEAISFRYVVDSFGLGLYEDSKKELVDICGERLDCLGIINMPSIKQFKKSASPYFLDANGDLSAEFIAQGGDLERGYSELYSKATGDGATAAGYFGPWVTIGDRGRPLNVPPAMYVARNYMRKHTTNNTGITPWTITAGITNGRIDNIRGLEIDFSPEDVSFLNQAQYNPIIRKKRGGFAIETENTALTEYRSSLSYLHSREVLIELENEIARMLEGFQWTYNTPDIRAEIKERADTICARYQNQNALFNFFNKIDEENNTPEIIDNQIGVLDTYVEISKGMGVIVNNVTILETGGIVSRGFI